MYCSTTDVAICHLLMFQKHGCPALVTGVYHNAVGQICWLPEDKKLNV